MVKSVFVILIPVSTKVGFSDNADKAILLDVFPYLNTSETKIEKGTRNRANSVQIALLFTRVRTKFYTVMSHATSAQAQHDGI